MNKLEAWNTFTLSGSVSDYLQFKALEEKEKDNKANESKDRRTDFKTTEYR